MASQGDLFGSHRPGRGAHRVAAHLRTLHDGTEVFVSEHLRWNRGEGARAAARAPRAPEVAEGQIPLFGAATSSARRR